MIRIHRTLLVAALAASAAVFPVHGQSSSGRRAQSTTLRRPSDGGYLGVGVIDLTDDRVRALGLKDNHGVEVTEVQHPSAAERAGLHAGDVLLEVNGKTIVDQEQFVHTISESNPGTKIRLTIWHDAARQAVTATLDVRPDNPFPGLPGMPPATAGQPFPFVLPGSPALVGFEGESLSPQLADYFGVKEGVLVRTVSPGTPAAKAGLKAGDVVTKVNGTPVTSPREISGLARARVKHLSFTVVRNHREITLDIEIAEFRDPFALFATF